MIGSFIFSLLEGKLFKMSSEGIKIVRVTWIFCLILKLHQLKSDFLYFNILHPYKAFLEIEKEIPVSVEFFTFDTQPFSHFEI